MFTLLWQRTCYEKTKYLKVNMKTLYYKYVCCCYYLISSLIFIIEKCEKLILMEAFSYRAFHLFSRQKSF